MLPPYSVRGQILTLLAEYKRLGSFYHKNSEAFDQNYELFKVQYDLVGPSRWDTGLWRYDAAFANVRVEIEKIGKQAVKLKEELESIEADAYTCYCSIAQLLPEMEERCQGSGRDLLRAHGQGFVFER